MIAVDVLFELIPDEPPGYERVLARQSAESVAAERIAGWAALLRAQLAVEISEGRNDDLGRLVDGAGFVGTGIFRAPREPSDVRSDFPTVEGLQFGAVLFRGRVEPEYEGSHLRSIPLPGGREAPVIQVAAQIDPHVFLSDGRIATYFRDEDGALCGITARHVVDQRPLGHHVAVVCPSGCPTRLRRRAPGLIDAAVVEVECHHVHSRVANVRAPREGEAVLLHLDEVRPHVATVMMTMQTSSQLRTAAIPQHFLTDLYGRPGESGSLVSTVEDQALSGMYLGSTVCEDRQGWSTTYGFSLELEQAAAIVGASAPFSVGGSW